MRNAAFQKNTITVSDLVVGCDSDRDNLLPRTISERLTQPFGLHGASDGRRVMRRKDT